MPRDVFDMRFARGFAMSNPFTWMGPNPRAFGSPGAGGAIVFADPDNGLAFGYAQNAHVGVGHQIDSRSGRVIQAIYEAL
jgi:CubicO group peptidase (beta-lactamase class C family)